MAKRKRNKIVKALAPPLILSGGAIGSSILGASLQSRLPAGATNPLSTTGATFSTFVAPVSAISASGIVFKELRKTKKKMKGGK